MSVKFENYIIATFAQWAGDIPKILDIHSNENYDPEQFAHQAIIDNAFVHIHSSAISILHSGDAKDTSVELLKEKFEKEFVITTDHLRGVIYKENEIEFQLRAYLVDLEWEKEFQEHALNLAKSNKCKRLEIPEKPPTKKENIFFGVVFLYEFTPLIHTTITPNGLIESVLIWNKKSKVNNAKVKELFVQLLKEIENPTLD